MEKCTTGPFLQFEKASTVALVHFLEPVLPSSQCGPRAGEIWTRTMSHSVWRFVVPRIPRAGTIWDRLGKKGGAHDDESLGSFHARDAPLFEGSGIPIVYILGGKDGARGAERHSGGENGQESCGAVNRRRSFWGTCLTKARRCCFVRRKVCACVPAQYCMMSSRKHLRAATCLREGRSFYQGGFVEKEVALTAMLWTPIWLGVDSAPMAWAATIAG